MLDIFLSCDCLFEYLSFAFFLYVSKYGVSQLSFIESVHRLDELHAALIQFESTRININAIVL